MTQKDIPKAVLGLAVLALGDALETTLCELAKHRENTAGPWLDALHKQFLDGIKRTRSKGFTEDEEFNVMRGAITILDMTMNAVRGRLASGSNDGD